MIRAFIGLPLPGVYQERLKQARGRLEPGLRSKLSWTRPGNWHVTLKFLGDIGDDRVEPISRALAGVAWDGFAVRGGGGGFFPGPDRPKVVWVGLALGADQCRDLAGRIERALEPLGLEPERRPFSPHLTVARVKRGERDPWPEALSALAAMDWPEFRAERFTLWKSELSSQGPTYTALAEFPAGGGA
jgi:2'-5' RNA ligase